MKNKSDESIVFLGDGIKVFEEWILKRKEEKMNKVEPIRDANLFNEICLYFKKTNKRNYLMFMLGVYTGLRISDVLALRVGDLKNRNTINIKEKKTGKQYLQDLNPELKQAIADYITDDMDNDEFLIKSRNGYNRPIGRVQAYNIIQKVLVDKFKLENVGTHTLRKTFGYHYYREYKDIVTLQTIFNHHDESVTKRYIGITQDTAREAIGKFKIK